MCMLVTTYLRQEDGNVIDFRTEVYLVFFLIYQSVHLEECGAGGPP